MSDLEQKIREAAEKATPGEWRVEGSEDSFGFQNYIINGYGEREKRDSNCAYIALASPANILALLAEKDAEIERLRGLIVPGDGSCDRCGKMPAIVMPTSLCDECIAGLKRAESAEQERGEWARIAGEYRNGPEHHFCKVRTAGLVNGTLIDDSCDECKAYDVLAGKGE